MKIITMEITQLLLSHIILLGLFSGLLCSNPDSIIVQDSSEDSSEGRTVRREAKKRSLTESDAYLRLQFYGMMPHPDGTRFLWRAVNIDNTARTQNRNVFISTINDLRNNRPSLSDAIEHRFTDANNRPSNRHQKPQINAQESNGNMRRALPVTNFPPDPFANTESSGIGQRPLGYRSNMQNPEEPNRRSGYDPNNRDLNGNRQVSVLPQNSQLPMSGRPAPSNAAGTPDNSFTNPNNGRFDTFQETRSNAQENNDNIPVGLAFSNEKRRVVNEPNNRGANGNADNNGNRQVPPTSQNSQLTMNGRPNDPNNVAGTPFNNHNIRRFNRPQNNDEDRTRGVLPTSENPARGRPYPPTNVAGTPENNFNDPNNRQFYRPQNNAGGNNDEDRTGGVLPTSQNPQHPARGRPSTPNNPGDGTDNFADVNNRPSRPQISPDRNNNNNNDNYGNRRVVTTPQNYPRPIPIPERPYNPSNEETPIRRVSGDFNFFAGIVNNFAFKLMDTMNLESNFVISPLSIFIALSMCYLGSEGNTKKQLERILGMDDNSIHEQHFHQGFRNLLSLIMQDSSQYELFVANGMFLGKDFQTNKQFEEDVQKYYNAELKNLDFGNSEASFQEINDWVAKVTRNMIPSLIDVPLPLFTRLILLNAIYFKGIWKIQFPRNLTYNGRFNTLTGTETEVPTMTLFGETFPLYRSDEHRHSFLKLPYKGDQISMIIALPYTDSEKPLTLKTDQILCNLQDSMVKVKLDTVAIPKFKLEETVSLKGPLEQLGITNIFKPNEVDLRNMRSQNDVIVESILHKAVVDVNEEGTTASASTAVQFVPLSLRNTTNFIANHPFAFYIVHEPSGLVLFYGKIFNLGDNVLSTANRRENTGIRSRPSVRDYTNGKTTRTPTRLRGSAPVRFEQDER